MHDRDIARRVDDFVVRRHGRPTRIMRRARGYAPAPVALPDGFRRRATVLAMGGELKSGVLPAARRPGHPVAPHGRSGERQDIRRLRAIDRGVSRLFEHGRDHRGRSPSRVSVRQTGERSGRSGAADLAEVQHHHAHVAACMAENGVAARCAAGARRGARRAWLGVDGTLWGGEFLLADYRDSGGWRTFKPVAMPGGAQAIREPWRNTYAHIDGRDGLGAVRDRLCRTRALPVPGRQALARCWTA